MLFEWISGLTSVVLCFGIGAAVVVRYAYVIGSASSSSDVIGSFNESMSINRPTIVLSGSDGIIDPSSPWVLLRFFDGAPPFRIDFVPRPSPPPPEPVFVPFELNIEFTTKKEIRIIKVAFCK